MTSIHAFRLPLLFLPMAFALSGAYAETNAPDSTEKAFMSEVRQVTFAGKRAGEGYFNADGTKLTFQSERDDDNPFFQIYVMDLESGDVEKASSGLGKTTCSWMHPDGTKILYASTQADPESKQKQEEEIAFRASGKERRYSWDYDEHYDIWETTLADKASQNLTNARGYDAEGSYSPNGEWIAFASNRHAYSETLTAEDQQRFELDKSYLMDIYIMKADGSDAKRLTSVPGYDGGPFFSADGQKICWRRFTPQGDQAEIWTMDINGSNQRQLTKLAAMSWAPFFHPSGRYLIFATNLQGFGNFELYLVDAEGTKEPVRVTDTDGFDGLPAFSPDGKTLSWTSNRTPNKTSQLFFAAWNHDAALAALGLDVTPLEEVAPANKPDVHATTAPIRKEDLKLHLTYLASDELEGRLTGTRGEKLATAYVAEVFAAAGLEPAGENGTYFQPFDFTAGVELGTGNALTVHQGDSVLSSDVSVEWIPLSFSQTGKVDPTEIVFAGYGIEAPEETDETGLKQEEYSSYAHLDVKDKWVLMFRYAPERLDDRKKQRFARYSSLRYKAMLARQHGAKGILVTSGPNSKVERQLVPLTFDASLSSSGIVALSVSDKIAADLLKTAQKDLGNLQTQLDGGDMVAGFTLPNTTVSANIVINEEKRTGRNVLARLSSGNSSPALIFGAHVDHLGSAGGANSRARSGEEGQIHYGADDNASGVAGMLEIAQYLSDLRRSGKLALERDIVFAAWSGEELGLLGSAHYVQALAKSVSGDADAKLNEQFAACLNMDMIGRLRQSLILQGVGSSDYWAGAIEQRNVPIGLPIVMQNDTYIPTDATSFYLRNVPILSAFTGAHDEYHTPRDRPETINYAGAESITKLMALITRSLATSKEQPNYKEAAKPENMNRGGIRVYLGTIPDYAQGDIKGVKLSGVRKNGPADKAGVQAGDIIVKLGGKAIENIYDYTYLLGALAIDQETEIVVKRKEEEISLKITPGSRD